MKVIFLAKTRTFAKVCNIFFYSEFWPEIAYASAKIFTKITMHTFGTHMLMTSPLTIIYYKRIFSTLMVKNFCWHFQISWTAHYYFHLRHCCHFCNFISRATSQMSHWEFVYWQYKTDGILSVSSRAVAKKLLSLDKKSVSMEKVEDSQHLLHKLHHLLKNWRKKFFEHSMNLLFCSDVAERAHALSHHHQAKLKLDKKKKWCPSSIITTLCNKSFPFCIDDWLGLNALHKANIFLLSQ